MIELKILCKNIILLINNRYKCVEIIDSLPKLLIQYGKNIVQTTTYKLYGYSNIE